MFMQEIEQRAIETAEHKSKLWFRYVDDTFIIWIHGEEKLKVLLEHINNIYHQIQLTMELEKNEQLPFLDVLIIKKENGHIGHTVYRKPIHTDRYLHADSHHHPAQLHSVIKILMTRSERLTEEEHKNKEMQNVKLALRTNGFSTYTIENAHNAQKRIKDPTKEENPIAIGIFHI
ncbi:uncharacterized protein [Diabrotica undecimpunctata]|uniref:uncharacterized protein n=1 Tax=Diabrotica undecimpunctata TaxID=50387 RepID=UPI003B63ED8C